MIDCGTVTKSKSDQGQSVVKVNILGRSTEWLPVLQEANSFKRKASPVSVGTQVVVLLNRYVIGAIFNQGCLEPDGASEHCEVCEYEDGTRISYDSDRQLLLVEAAKNVTITAKGNATVNTKGATTINAHSHVTINSKKISLNGGSGVITGESICPYTKAPHGDASTKVFAGK